MSHPLQQDPDIPSVQTEKTVAIMQPYFLPYIGYWQMMQAADEFIVYDDVQFSKGGWINRNRMLLDGDAHTFSLPLRKGNLADKINARFLTDSWAEARTALQSKFSHGYSKAPLYSQVMPIVERVLAADHVNLADFLTASLREVQSYLGITTPLLRSSGLTAGQGLRASERVLAICKARGARTYINAPGGRELYDKGEFRAHGIDLKFIDTGDITYRQFNEPFVPSLSILDVMMFNDPAVISDMLGRYTLD